MEIFSLSSLLRPATPIVLMDIGASLLEDPPYQPLIDAGLVSLIGFEPNREECAKLQAKYGAPHRFFPHFIGDGRPATFYETNWFATGSLFKPNKPVLEKFQNLYEMVTPLAEHPVETRALDTIAEIERVDYIKIDVQGSELAVFQGAERLLRDTLVIQTEVEFLELYEKQPLFADVDTHLRSRDFIFTHFIGVGSRAVKPAILNQGPYSGNQHLWADVLYLKNWFDPTALSADQLTKLAIIMHDIYKLYDFCYNFLVALDTRSGTNHAPRYVETWVQLRQSLTGAGAAAPPAAGR